MQSSRLATARIKSHQILHVIFGTKSWFSSVSWDITLLYFFVEIFLCFAQMHPIEVQISTARIKINQIPYVISQPRRQFSFKLCKILLCHDTYFIWKFLAETAYALDKESPSMYNFTFGCSNDESSPNSSCHLWNQKVRVFQILHHCSVSWKINPLYFF